MRAYIHGSCMAAIVIPFGSNPTVPQKDPRLVLVKLHRSSSHSALLWAGGSDSCWKHHKSCTCQPPLVEGHFRVKLIPMTQQWQHILDAHTGHVHLSRLNLNALEHMIASVGWQPIYWSPSIGRKPITLLVIVGSYTPTCTCHGTSSKTCIDSSRTGTCCREGMSGCLLGHGRRMLQRTVKVNGCGHIHMLGALRSLRRDCAGMEKSRQQKLLERACPIELTIRQFLRRLLQILFKIIARP